MAVPRPGAVALLPLLAVLVLMAAACGGDEAETDTETGGTDTVDTQATAIGTEATNDGTDDTGDASQGVVRFVRPTNNATVSSPVAWEAVAEGFKVEPAAEGVNEGAGHLHILVDAGCAPEGEVIPGDETHLHFGDGSTSGNLDLAPGRHTLCLQAANGAHEALPLTHEITVTVQ